MKRGGSLCSSRPPPPASVGPFGLPNGPTHFPASQLEKEAEALRKRAHRSAPRSERSAHPAPHGRRRSRALCLRRRSSERGQRCGSPDDPPRPSRFACGDASVLRPSAAPRLRRICGGGPSRFFLAGDLHREGGPSRPPLAADSPRVAARVDFLARDPRRDAAAGAPRAPEPTRRFEKRVRTCGARATARFRTSTAS